MTPHREFMQAAIEEAGLAAAEGEVPVGAVLAVDGEIVARDHNRTESEKDPTAHAEMLVVRKAALKAGDRRLEGATLYVTLEPCPMCAAAIALARVARVVFGASDPRAGAGGSAYNILEDGRLGHRTEVIAGIMEDECRTLLQEFFDGLR